MHARLVVSITLCLTLGSAPASAQYHQTDFPAEEFKSRHARVFEQIGATAVAVIQGVAQTEGYTLPRQHNTFYYLSGIETPGAYLLLDGRTKTVTIYLPARNPRLEAAEDRVLSAEDVELVNRLSGAGKGTVVVTETGVENFTHFLPMELNDIEKLVLEKGVVQKVPPIPASAIK